MRTKFKSAFLQFMRFLLAEQGDNRKHTKNFSVLKFGSASWARTRDLRINRKIVFLNFHINQWLIWVKIERVINRLIPNFVALRNKLVFLPILTWDGLKNQVDEGGSTPGVTW